MTRTHAAKKLLEHGPLTFPEFWAITGWDKEEAKDILASLVAHREIQEQHSNFRYDTRYKLES